MILRNRQRIVITITSVAVLLAVSTVYSNLDVIEAYAGVSLSSDNVAKTIQVRVSPAGSGAALEKTYDSFSRVGFVAGEGNFLLESVPSKDKRPYYELLKKSIEGKGSSAQSVRMHVSIDLYSGDGEIIQTLEYRDCIVDEYFVHGVDSKGKIFFLEEDGTVEIREVTKFNCVSFTLNIDPLNERALIEKTLQQLEEAQKKLEEIDIALQFEYEGDDPFFSYGPESPEEGDLFYNSMTNILQKFVNGNWTNISGVGGPPSPRR